MKRIFDMCTSFSGSRSVTRLGAVLWTGLSLSLASAASAQVAPTYAINYPQGFEGVYFDDTNFTNLKLARPDAAIDFDWANAAPDTGSPTPLLGSDTFSVRWTGKIMPQFTEDYTFYAVADDGVRVWVNDQLLIDKWFEQAPTEYASAPVALTAGVNIDIKVEYYENTGTAVARLLWSSPSLPKTAVRSAGCDPAGFPKELSARIGSSFASLGNGRYVVGGPYAGARTLGPFYEFNPPGFAWLYDQHGQSVGFAKAPLTTYQATYGRTLAAFPDGRFLAGGVYSNVGTIFLHDFDGNLLRSWSSPSNNITFGSTLVTLPGNRFAAVEYDQATASDSLVYIFDASTSGGPLTVIRDTTPSGFERFGRFLAPLGANRILVSDTITVGDVTSVRTVNIYDLNGTRLREIRSPTGTFDLFGNSILALDDRRFLIGSPWAPVVYLSGGQLATNDLAGAVYLYDDTGSRIRTFTGPEPAYSQNFGEALSLLGPERLLVGAPWDRVNGIHSGRVHLFNLDGTYLTSVNNPEPDIGGDAFGGTLAALDDGQFVVGAPYDSTRHTVAGSVYGYDLSVPVVELGAEIPRPDGVDAGGMFPLQGPRVSPAGSTFWHVPSGKLFAVKPGALRVTWPLLNNQTNTWEGVLGWPTNTNDYQIHVAGQAAVDLGEGATFSNVVLHATTTDANPLLVSQTRRFLATVPGDSFVMLAAGDPSTTPIRFQFIRSIAWNDPAYLHDNAPAVVGQPIADPANYFDPACGSPQVVQAASVYCPAPVFDPATRTGTIIPVNRDNPATESDDLVVAFYQRGTKLFDPVSKTLVASGICWPAKPVRYRPAWPANAPAIVIASQQGTGVIDPAQFVDWQLYFQNQPTQAGFNPNDEHALRRPVAGGEGLFALRDDLGTPASSEPFVLIRYRDPAAGLQWRMKVWRVVAEQAPFFFRYPALAGQRIQPPFPLSTLDDAPETVGTSGPYWRDRKLDFWARAAGDNGGLAEIVMGYFYPMQPGFFYPGGDPPPVGASVPFLDQRAGTPGVPLGVKYDTSWPGNAPQLHVGETLVKPKNGLPQIAGESSVEIVYQQSAALDQSSSVRLIDPVRARTTPLAQLPPDLPTRTRAGLLYFPSLLPHLEGRFSYDPVARQLRFRGDFVEPPAGESYLLLNVITPREKAALLALSADAGYRAAVEALAQQAGAVAEVPSDSTGFDSLALTAGAGSGTGYVTLAFGNSTNLSAPAEPVSLAVIQVTCPLYRGEIKVIESANPLAEQLTMRHSGDFAGEPERFVFEWRTLPPVDGLPSPTAPEQWSPFVPVPASGIGATDITIAGAGLYTLSDNYFICRYRPVNGDSPCGADWSAWTPPMLAEGWVKRVLAGIGPFEQRIQDYQDTQVNTIVGMISQAGPRAVGDIALNLDAVNDAGLIEVYETVLHRGLGLSIEGTPAVDYPPANDALLLAAGRLADLYMLLGNEAYADAADPTIAFGTDDGVYGSQAASIYCFMNQTASLLEEELGLLRGRDSSKLPSVQTHPFYNRFIWNFTRDITGGELAYALNYNIRNVDGDIAGTINEADARRLYPQGHGDAWGHYLMAIKNYYRLLRNTNFTWVPRIEAVLVGGVPVSVDYLDERKFAAGAAARARTGAEIVNLTFRDVYVETPARPWQNTTDPNADRAWSLADWASRAGQGALFDWVVANALLPDVDKNPTHTGIQKIERGTVRELPEIAGAYRRIQEQADEADSGRNPLGLARNVVPFDIDPSAIAAGKTHFDQINERANEALKNAVAVFDHANGSSQLLRRQADDANDFQQRVEDSEADYNSRLIEIFGTPYTDDIGPTGTYPTGYTGPDIYHYDYTDNPEIRAGVTNPQQVVQLQLTDLAVDAFGALSQTSQPVALHFSANGFGLEKPAAWTGQRAAPGEIQQARGAMVEALRRLERSVAEYDNLIDQIEDSARGLRAEFQLNDRQIALREKQLGLVTDLDEQIRRLRGRASEIRLVAQSAHNIALFAAEALPEVVGLANDAFSFQAAMLRLIGREALLATEVAANMKEEEAVELQDQKNQQAALTDLELFTLQTGFGEQERLRALEQLVRTEFTARLELAALEQSLSQASGRYSAAVARGLRLLEERTRFRQKTAAQIQQYRHRDMAFRLFRSDALQKYRAQFDLAARYAYLAAKAYDYETCLAPQDQRGPGTAFLTGIIRSRALGRFFNGAPLPGNSSGDPGLADPLARMTANWNLVLKGQLGFNNPQTETGRFSLRNELFRIVNGSAGSQRWRETLLRHVEPNLLDRPEFHRHCIPFSPTQPVEPAIVIPFSTTINFGLNFFGWPAGGGDNDYDSTKFATKIRSVGVWFANYNNLGGGMINTPRVYLVPVGIDVMRAPSQDAFIREWRVLDQALPVPFPLSAGSLDDPDWIPINDTLSEDLSAIRRFGRFRAFHDSGSFSPAETINDSRLIGRSVWNTRWLLIIPAGTLHTDRNEGIQRFINGALKPDGTRDGNGVTDIKIFFQTYAYSGN